MLDALRLACLSVLTGLGVSAAAQAGEAVVHTFSPIYRVLTGPRCLNCHSAANFPRQGDERRPHDFLVRRGNDGRGAAAMRCSTCHGARNNGIFPGAPHWGLAPKSMAWENLDAGQLCRRLKDPAQNGRRTVTQLVEHMSTDPLVQWGWEPGARRAPVELPKKEFVQALQTWADLGAPCPTR